MSLTICMTASTLYYPEGGGHMWVYINWALGFRSLGCKVVWLEEVKADTTVNELRQLVATLKNNLAFYGLSKNITLWQTDGKPLSADKQCNCLEIEVAAEAADILINQNYKMPASVVGKFRRTVLLDIDPGLLQMWLSKKYFEVAPHDVYFTIGETVGQTSALFPDCGFEWQYTPPCVSLDHWPVSKAAQNASLTTITHWTMHEFMEDNGQVYTNDKRTAYQSFLTLPDNSSLPLELAVSLGKWDQELDVSPREKD